jgi:hypothetical protein
MSKKLASLLVILSICASAQRASAQLPELNSQTIDAYRLAIEPTKTETAFLSIGWYSQLRQAVSKAFQSDKPLLIYLMNGHPLGCT